MNGYENINKIMFQNILLRRIRETFKVIIIITSFNIVFILFQKNYIVYSRFKILLNAITQFFCDVIYKFDLIELLRAIELIF